MALDVQSLLHQKLLLKVESQKSVNKTTYYWFIKLIRFIPATLALIEFAHTLVGCFGYDSLILRFVGGSSLLPLILLILMSYTFKYCKWHRIPLWYCLTNVTIASLDYNIGLPISTMAIDIIYVVLFVIYLIAYFTLFKRSNGKLQK